MDPQARPDPVRAARQGGGGTRSADELVHVLAARQHGLVTRGQLLQGGVGRRAIDYRIQSGQLQPVHRGVYRVGPVIAPHSRELAAVLACGRGAVLSHWSAVPLWGLTSPARHGALVVVTTLAGVRRRIAGIRQHRAGGLSAKDVTRRFGIPITTAERTLLDVAADLGPRPLEQAVARAEREGLIRRVDLERVLERHPTRRGAGALRALLDELAEPRFTRSEAEERFLEWVEKARLDRPETNVEVWGHQVDLLWRRELVIVEVDGFAWHGSRDRFEADRRRDAELAGHGALVLRVTWRQLEREPEAMIASLALTLGTRRRSLDGTELSPLIPCRGSPAAGSTGAP